MGEPAGGLETVRSGNGKITQPQCPEIFPGNGRDARAYWRNTKTLGIPYFTDLPILHKQHLAVYFFFCLSGFLIIRILYEECRKGRINTLNFYRKRMLRIFPLYFIVLFTGVAIYYYLLPHMGIMTGFSNDPLELIEIFYFFSAKRLYFTTSPGCRWNTVYFMVHRY